MSVKYVASVRLVDFQPFRLAEMVVVDLTTSNLEDLVTQVKDLVSNGKISKDDISFRKEEQIFVDLYDVVGETKNEDVS